MTTAGLRSAEVDRLRVQYGKNDVPEQRVPLAVALLRKFWGPIPWLLEATIALQVFLDKRGEAAIIACLLFVNAVISFIEEGRASKAISLLRRRLTTQTRVLRDGRWQSLSAAELVPGDRVHLRMGDLSPADIRIAEGEILLDQSALTGESVPVEVKPGAMAYAAASVKRGEASGDVVATGTRTYFGKTAELVKGAGATSHLQRMIFAVVKSLVVLDLILIGGLFAYSAWTNLPFAELIPFGLILLVASVPVALPATFTVATALGAAELARNGVLVTRLTAIEEAAGMDVLCTDKTGTMTQNRLTLSDLQPLPPASEEALLRFAALASDVATQDPIDLAVLAAAQQRGIAVSLQRTDFTPFDPALRYSLGLYRDGAASLCVVKGAFRAVAALVPHAPDIANEVEQLAAEGRRVLAVASGPSRDALQLVGLVGLEDPPRADSAALVDGLRALGVRVVMITGDNLATARAIARQIGLGTRAATPEAFDQLDGNRALDYDVYARVFPEQKIRLIRLLQSSGHVVGMTGDGVNDAPALKQADIGIAVSGATDVARAAAGVVLTAAGLTNALAAVQISRRIYQRMLTYTINKIVKTLEIAVFLSVGVMLTHVFVITPMLIVLLLFTNDFVTMSIATDRVAFSREPDRWHIPTLMLTGGLLAAFVLVLSFSVFFVGRDVIGLPLPQLQTLVFVMLVATGQGNIYLVRERSHFWKSPPSRWLFWSSIADLAVVTVLATRGLLMAPLAPPLIAAVLGAVAVYLLILDQIKVLVFRRLSIR